LSRLSDKPLVCEHRGAGEVVVQIDTNSNRTDFRLRYRRRRLVRYGRHNIGRKKGAFFKELAHEGFIRNGAIAINGCPKVPSPAVKEYPVYFQTVLQVDGDLVCKIDCNLLYREDFEVLLRAYTSVRSAFMQDFQGALNRSLSRIMFSLSLLTFALGVLYKLWFSWDGILIGLESFLRSLDIIP
jgi:hypothetical protein